MPNHSLRIGLFDPGMTHTHRVGLAGLFMTLSRLNPEESSVHGNWILEPHSVTLCWHKSPADLLMPILKDSFAINNGLVDFSAHRNHPMGDLERIILHNAVKQTYLQHPLTGKTEKDPRVLTVTFEDCVFFEKVKALKSYMHQNHAALFTGSQFSEDKELKGWLIPGGIVRHEEYSNETALRASPEKLLCLLFAPVGSLYYTISHRQADGKYDKKMGAAIVLPHIKNLSTYSHCHMRYLESPAKKLCADSLGDAGMMALTAMHSFGPAGMVSQIEVDSCTVVTMGALPWSPRQKSRTSVVHILGVDPAQLNAFSLALSSLSNRPYADKEGGFRVHASPSRGLIAENIALRRDWFQGFYRLLRTKQLSQILHYERRGLNEMVNEAPWTSESDRVFVESIHNAIRKRYGALASRARQKGEVPRFDREFERMRSSLARAKNGQTLRAELADLFARGGINKNLQEHWQAILPLFLGPHWQKARDLALLALASYAGEGAKELETLEEKEEEEQ